MLIHHMMKYFGAYDCFTLDGKWCVKHSSLCAPRQEGEAALRGELSTNCATNTSTNFNLSAKNTL